MQENNMSTDEFFKSLVELDQENDLRSIYSYINHMEDGQTEDDIQDLLKISEEAHIIVNRLHKLEVDIRKTMPYVNTYEFFVISAVLSDNKGFNKLLDQLYKEIFEENAPETSLPFEKKLDVNQKETFHKLHRILAELNKDPENRNLEEASDKLGSYYLNNFSRVLELMYCKSANAKPIKEFEKLPTCLKCSIMQEIRISFSEVLDRDKEQFYVLMNMPIIKKYLGYCGPEVKVGIMLMFTDARLFQFLTEEEKDFYKILMERYGKCKTVGEILDTYRYSPHIGKPQDTEYSVKFALMYANRLCSGDFEQYLNSTRISKKDLEDMIAFASLKALNNDLMVKEVQLLLESFIFTYNRLTDSEKNQKKKPLQEKSYVEKYRRESQDLKKENQRIEKELKSEKELRKKAEEEIQKTKKYYKHTQDKENRSLKRENEDLKEQIKVLEERIKNLENQDRLEEIDDSGEIQASGDPIISHGEVEDFWPDEEKEMILDTLNDRLKNLQEGTRRKQLIEDVLKNNNYRGVHQARKNNLKIILKGFRNMDSATESKLKEQGFTVIKSKNHTKITFMDDPRYTISMPSTGSDSRNGDNLASELGSLVF